MTAYAKTGRTTGQEFRQADLEQVETQYDCAQEEYEAASWVTKAVHLREDFLGADFAPFWYSSVSGGATPDAYITNGAGGWLELYSEESGDIVTVSTGILSFILENGASMRKVRFTAIVMGANIQTEFKIGLTGDFGVDEWVCFAFDSGATPGNWYVSTAIDGGATNLVDTGVAVAASGTPVLLQFELSNGHAKFYIDGALTNDIVVNLGFSNLVKPFMWFKNTDNSANGVDIDLIDLAQERAGF